jgi:hypothetical protein
VARWFSLYMLLGILGSLASGVRAAGADTNIFVIAAPEHGPTVTHFFRAVVQARLPEVQVDFVPESQAGELDMRARSLDLVFRLDTRRPSEWRLRLEYQGRAWISAIEGGLAEDAAAVEAAALMAARTSVALLLGPAPGEEPNELQAWSAEPPQSSAPAASAPPVVPPGQPSTSNDSPAPVPNSVRRERRLELGLLGAYHGSSYAAEYPWMHGIELAAVLGAPAGPCGSLSYAYLERAHVRSEFGSFEVARQQAKALLGWCFAFGALGASPKLGMLVEGSWRSATQPNSGVGVSPDQRTLSWAGVTAIEVTWGIMSGMDAFAALSGIYFVADQEFRAEGISTPLLAPYRVRLSLELGATFQLF